MGPWGHASSAARIVPAVQTAIGVSGGGAGELVGKGDDHAELAQRCDESDVTLAFSDGIRGPVIGFLGEVAGAVAGIPLPGVEQRLKLLGREVRETVELHVMHRSCRARRSGGPPYPKPRKLR